MSNQREQGKVKIGIGFDVEQKGIKTLRKQLMDIQKISVDTYKKMSGDNLKTEQAQKELNKIKTTAKQVEKALNNAFNSRLNTVNIQQFKKQLNGLSWGKIYSDFNKLGATGNKAFNSLTNGVLSTNAELKKTDSILDKFAKTLGNSIKWTAASAAVKGVAASVQQAFGYVKSLDNSLNNIRIVTKKSSEEMAEFAVQANKAAKALGASTTDYTDAALIYAQQGLSDKQIKARTEVTLKAANVTKQSAETVSQQLTAVWNGFKVNAEESQVAVDKLAAVASKSASSLKQLALGMSKVASAANSMGTSEDQLAAQISTIISVTRQAPETVGAALIFRA